MKILSYSPKVEAYVKVVANDSATYYDITDDIVSCSVNRNGGGESTFDIVLQNHNFKYNHVFTPMDVIVIYATKKQRHKLLTGYITRTDRFTLYQGDFSISGKCSLYRIQQLYWDPGLVASYQLLLEARSSNPEWAGFAQTIFDLLNLVGGMSDMQVAIGEIPQEAIAFAQTMYEKRLESSKQAVSMTNEFYKILQTHGPSGTFSGSGSGSGGTQSGNAVKLSMKGKKDAQKVVKLYTSWVGKFAYSQAGGRLDPLNTGYGDCSSTIWRAYMDALGMDVGGWTGAMVGLGSTVATGSGQLPIEKMELGDLCLFNWSGYNPSYDHVELYCGDNVLCGHGGPGNGPTYKNDARSYGTAATDWQVRRYIK